MSPVGSGQRVFKENGGVLNTPENGPFDAPVKNGFKFIMSWQCLFSS
jgi:hypothetical protein